MKKSILILAIGAALISCKENNDCEGADCDGGLGYDVPTSYNFENVSYSGQTERLDMLAELSSTLKSGANVGTTLNAVGLKEMYKNQNMPFSDAELNASTKNLFGKTFALDTLYFLNLLDSAAKYAGTSVTGSNGVAGIVEDAGSGSKYLCDANGYEYAQMFEKGIMGAVFYYQAVEYYLTELKIGASVDNITVTPGEGTDREHHFDEAFGYFGSGNNFPSVTDDARFWAKYCNSRNGILGTNQAIMDAWLTGRAALSNNDQTTQDAQVAIIKTQWEKVVAGTALHYINGGIDNIANDAVRNHELSEAVAFLKCLKYYFSSTISDSEIAEIITKIGDNLYNTTTSDLISARDQLAGIYGWESNKTEF